MDDSAVDREVIGGLLQNDDQLLLESAENGREALERLAEGGIDLVIADLIMPEIDGQALVRRIKKEHPGVPVILVTSQGSEELAVTTLRDGAASYVPKRLLADLLEDTVDSVLEQTLEQRRRATVLGSLQDAQFEFALDNDRTAFGSLISYLQEAVGAMGSWDGTVRMQIGLALEEALVNAAEHGNLALDSVLRNEDRRAYFQLAEKRRRSSPYQERRVLLAVRLSQTELRFEVTDEGDGFDISALPDPTDPSNLLKSSGRGVMLMRSFFDEVNFNERGNRVELLKRRS